MWAVAPSPWLVDLPWTVDPTLVPVAVPGAFMPAAVAVGQSGQPIPPGGTSMEDLSTTADAGKLAGSRGLGFMRRGPGFLEPHVPGLTDQPIRWDEGPPWPSKSYHVSGWYSRSDKGKIKLLRKYAKEYGRDPRLRAFTINHVLRPAGVISESRQYEAQARAILAWVQQNIAYMNEPSELLQGPWQTLKVKYGDCFAAGTLVLRDDYELIPIERVEPGMRIWGKDAWSTVTDWTEKGDLAIDVVTLNNGSTLRLTGGHKVYVKHCELHGALCPDILYSRSNCAKAGRSFHFDRIHVSELREGMELLSPESIAFGKNDMDPDRAYVEGLYLADGWADGGNAHLGYDTPCRFSISGLDGHPKEDQKRRVEHICKALGVDTRWHRKYIAVNDSAWAQRLAAMGTHAWEKAVASLDLAEPAARALLEGLMADAGRNTHGKGWTYSSTSYRMAIQARVLHKMFGRTASLRRVDDHGGFGEHPIYRLGIRGDREDGQNEKRLRVKSIAREAATVPCYDITTSDHYVYLPEADATVSNCDDMALLMSAMAESIALPWRLTLAGKHKVTGRPIRWREGERFPRGANFFHIYVTFGWPPFKPTTWMSAEPTMRVPLGHDVIVHGVPQGQPGLSGLAGWDGDPGTVPLSATLPGSLRVTGGIPIFDSAKEILVRQVPPSLRSWILKVAIALAITIPVQIIAIKVMRDRRVRRWFRI